MPLVILVLLALTAGLAAAVLATFLQRRAAAPVADRTGGAAGAVRRNPWLRRTLASRMDAGTLTGLALTLALLALLTGGIVVGGLAVLLHGNPTIVGLDARISAWAHRHATTWSRDGLDVVTNLGGTVVVIALAMVLAVVETARTRSRWITPFLLAVLAGELLLSTTIKGLVDRARPTLNPTAQTLGPSFPSGHTTAAAAFYTAAALVIGRSAGPRARAALAGAAVGIAVAVAASRVLLDVHWVTDVIGGLALGWAWFAACSIAFGGRLLRFGAPAAAAGSVAAASPPSERPARVEPAPNGYGVAAGFPQRPHDEEP